MMRRQEEREVRRRRRKVRKCKFQTRFWAIIRAVTAPAAAAAVHGDWLVQGLQDCRMVGCCLPVEDCLVQARDMRRDNEV